MATGAIVVGVSSIGSVFGNGAAPAYNASKAYVTRSLEGLRYRRTDRTRTAATAGGAP